MAQFNNNQTIYERIVSASFGALVTSLFVTPLEVLKVRVQAQQAQTAQIADAFEPNITKTLLNARSAVECALCREVYIDNGLMEHRFNKEALKCFHVVPPATPLFSSTFEAFRYIVKYEGPKSLFNGLQPTLWMTVPSTVLYFGLYEELRDFLNYKSPLTQTINPLFSRRSS